MLTPWVMSYETRSVVAAHAPMAATPRVTATRIFFVGVRMLPSAANRKILPRRLSIVAQATVMVRVVKPE